MTASDVSEPAKATSGSISPPPTGLLGGLGAIAGLGALAASSCCALPLLLAGLGAGGAVFSGLETLADLRPFLLGGAVIALAVGWISYYRRRVSAACRQKATCTPATSITSLIVLSAGTFFVGLALAWNPYFDSVLLKLAR